MRKSDRTCAGLARIILLGANSIVAGHVVWPSGQRALRDRSSRRPPDEALTNPLFYLKLGLIAIALVTLRSIVRRIRSAPPMSRMTKMLAVASLVVGAATIAAGRFLAYTCTRLTVDLSC
jgi:hypothetical protein